MTFETVSTIDNKNHSKTVFLHDLKLHPTSIHVIIFKCFNFIQKWNAEMLVKINDNFFLVDRILGLIDILHNAAFLIDNFFPSI